MTSPRLQYSRIGLGTATFGREINRDQAFLLMDHAQAKGVNHFDSAARYSNGESERIIGAWLASRRPAPGSVLVPTKTWFPYTPESVATAIDQSLVNLGVDCIDCYYFHQWHETAADPAVLKVLEDYVRAGKIRTLGASNFNAEQLRQVIHLQKQAGYSTIQALQNNNNYAVRKIDGPAPGGASIRRSAQ